MRASISLVTSIGDTFRLRYRRATSSMEAKARSLSVIGRKRKEFNTEATEEAQRTEKTEESEDFFLVAEISEGADISDDEGDAELIIGAHLAKLDTSIFESEAATFAVVADLHELILQRAIGDVVADAGGKVEAAPRFTAVAREQAHLIRERLKNGVGLQAEVGNGGEEFAIRLDLYERADNRDLAQLRVVFEQMLGIKAAARCDLEVADDR